MDIIPHKLSIRDQDIGVLKLTYVHSRECLFVHKKSVKIQHVRQNERVLILQLYTHTKKKDCKRLRSEYFFKIYFHEAAPNVVSRHVLLILSSVDSVEAPALLL